MEDFASRKLSGKRNCVERAAPKSVGINAINRLFLGMRLAAGIKRKPAYCLRVTCASSLFNLMQVLQAS